ncbi:hypothetical protein [Sinorhizobium fredii]|nr:hypothetical protein [Sinorhizobium fredii]
MSKRPQTPWEDYCHRGGLFHSFASFAVLGLFLVTVALCLP